MTTLFSSEAVLLRDGVRIGLVEMATFREDAIELSVRGADYNSIPLSDPTPATWKIGARDYAAEWKGALLSFTTGDPMYMKVGRRPEWLDAR